MTANQLLDLSPLYCFSAGLILALVYLIGWATGGAENEKQNREKYQRAIDNLRDVPHEHRQYSLKRTLLSRIISFNHRKGSKL